MKENLLFSGSFKGHFPSLIYLLSASLSCDEHKRKLKKGARRRFIDSKLSCNVKQASYESGATDFILIAEFTRVGRKTLSDATKRDFFWLLNHIEARISRNFLLLTKERKRETEIKSTHRRLFVDVNYRNYQKASALLQDGCGRVSYENG